MSKQPHIFAGNPLDRGERERRDEAWITGRAKDQTSKFLPMSKLNVLLSEKSTTELGWITIDDLDRMGIDAIPVFLGLLDGAAHFAVDVSNFDGVTRELESVDTLRFEDCRAASSLVSGPDAGIVAQARAQIDWHTRHRFCSVCGQESVVARGGQKRVCPNCNTQHFPRTDPVVITVVSDNNDRCLLGQSRGRLSRMRTYSALAGFVDQGESIEEAVAREVMEEAGIAVENVRYHSSQPWPFPSSLMIGCHADAAGIDIAFDDEEMTDVRWFHRDEVLLALEGKSETLTVPGPIAIAHYLIKAWATHEHH